MKTIKYNNRITEGLLQAGRFIRIAIIYWGISAILTSCEDFVEVDLPNSQLTGEAVFSDYNTAEAALVNLYSVMRDESILSGKTSGIGTLMGLYTDELDLFNNSLPNQEQFYNNTVLPSGSRLELIWNNSYNLIYGANSVIEKAEASAELNEDEKERLKGESLFIRGLLHFYLVNLFGEVPYIRTTDYRKNTEVAKLDVAEVYSNIIEDLQTSKDLLPADYLSPLKVRPNKWTVSALLSRVYLYAEDYENASKEATEVIEDAGMYSLQPDLDQVFKAGSPETIWQFAASTPGFNTYEAQTYKFVSIPPPTVALTEQLVSSFDSLDLRKNNWIGSIKDSTAIYYYADKYKLNTETPGSEELSIVFRLAEQFLIRSEAKANLEETEEALDDLNVIRLRAGLSELSGLSRSEILDAINKERRHELFTEFGHRWFDLRRQQLADPVLSPIKLGWDATDVLLPIPEDELRINPNLEPQNPGY